MRKTFLVLALFALVVSLGCISHTMYGTEVTKVLSPGASLADIVKTHGAPDQILELGCGEGGYSKYIVVFRIGGGDILLGSLMGNDKFSNVAYLVEDGKVKGGGYVGEGSGSYLLGIGFPLQPHSKLRAGWGGDSVNPPGLLEGLMGGGAKAVAGQVR
jgi:hypothetical protein